MDFCSTCTANQCCSRVLPQIPLPLSSGLWGQAGIEKGKYSIEVCSTLLLAGLCLYTGLPWIPPYSTLGCQALLTIYKAPVSKLTSCFLVIISLKNFIYKKVKYHIPPLPSHKTDQCTLLLHHQAQPTNQMEMKDINKYISLLTWPKFSIIHVAFKNCLYLTTVWDQGLAT